jgi:methylisocitrate lyase
LPLAPAVVAQAAARVERSLASCTTGSGSASTVGPARPEGGLPAAVGPVIGASGGIVVAPGAFNGLVGRAVANAGFSAAYLSGGSISAASGVPDIGLLSREHFCRAIREVVSCSGLPVLADADTGFGEEECAVRTVVDYIHCGAAGLHLEDQVFPKKCGHLDGKRLVTTEDFCAKVAACVSARNKSRDPYFVIGARTDARHVSGGIADVVHRASAYVAAGKC